MSNETWWQEYYGNVTEGRVRFACGVQGCGGSMMPYEGAYRCKRCKEVDAPMDDPAYVAEYQGHRLRIVTDFDDMTLRRLAHWWRRQWDGYGEFDIDHRGVY